ncbi:MAG: hypothetical protein ACFFAS_14940 [Promethearchaeota archaeon]
MVDKHDYPFFGQTTGIIISSNSMIEPYFFLKCFKKKENGSWEKASLREGKTTKFSLEEMMEILEVFDGKCDKWNAFHDFNGEKTQISFNWEKNQRNVLWVKINSYARRLQGGQMGIFRKLLSHLIKEKVKHATVMNKPRDRFKESVQQDKKSRKEYHEKNQEPIDKVNDKVRIKGTISGETDRAFLISFENGQELWVPKSSTETIGGREGDSFQELVIDE